LNTPSANGFILGSAKNPSPGHTKLIGVVKAVEVVDGVVVGAAVDVVANIA